MKKMNFFIIPFKSIKRNFLPILFFLFTLCLLLFSKSNLTAAKEGLTLWVNSVVPALFPFFVATELLSHTNFISMLGKCFRNIMRPIFNVPGEGSFALLMGIISGYPVGAKIASQFRSQNICTKEEAERLLAFTNNSGPLFILGTVGISLFCDTTTGIVLLVTHILACFTVGFLFRFWKRNKVSKPTSISSKTTSSLASSTSFSDLGEILGNSIMHSISTIVMIGGFVVLFSVILSILKQSHILSVFSGLLTPFFHIFHIPTNFIQPFLTGFLELTNGVKQIASISYPSLSVNIILCSFLLGFGGISVLLQVFSIIAKTDISIFPYFLGKFLQGLFAAFYTFLAFSLFPFLSLDLVPTFSNQTPTVLPSSPSYFMLTILFACFCFSFLKLRKKKKVKKNTSSVS